jgi:rhodanese-related sulfurtransferase
MDVISPEQYLESTNGDALLLDVRTVAEFEKGHIEGAVNIPVDSLRERIGELDKNKDIIEYCQVGLRGYIAARILNQNGFKVKNMTGGYKSASTLKFKINKTVKAAPSDKQIDPDTQTVKIK